MKKGFTLIELLAVIVILAIIALIATPIILGIINEAREESNKRSVELYASAVRNGIAAYQLSGKEVMADTYGKENPLPFVVEYDGNVVCETIEVYENGGVYVADCTVNGTYINYTYGTEQQPAYIQVYKPQYYYYAKTTGSSGTTLPNGAKENASQIETYGNPFYLGFDASDNQLIDGYVCFVRNKIEYCIKGWDEREEIYETNKSVLEDAFKDVVGACSFGDDSSSCQADGLTVEIYPIGHVRAKTTSQCDLGLGIYACN